MNEVSVVVAALLLVMTVLVLIRMIINDLKEPKEWWIRTDHKWYTRILCAAGIHLRGSSGMSCMYNITVCKHCGKDVFFVLVDSNKD